MQNFENNSTNIVRVNYSEIKSRLEKILVNVGFSVNNASELAEIFADNSLYGKDSHGVNRFGQFVKSVQQGYVKADSSPEKISLNNAFEQWDGNLGAGPLNARFCTERAIQLADKNGIGLVALRNTNHWMRGGTYGWLAAEAGYIFICWTNAIPTMPQWGSDEPKLGNNPLVVSIPKKDGHIVLDMAMSQYSYGRLETLRQSGRETDYYAGYDKNGNLTKDPSAVIESKRAMPIGMWKGAGLSLMLDLVAAILSGGRSSHQIGKDNVEKGVSQVFIAVKPGIGNNESFAEKIINETIGDILLSNKIDEGEIVYPGEKSYKKKTENAEKGVPVDKQVWEEMLRM